MSDPLAEIIAMLNLRAVLTKTIEGAGEWRVIRSDQGMSFYGVVLEGGCRLEIDQHPPQTLRAGDFMLIPAAYRFALTSLTPPPSPALETTPVKLAEEHFRLGALDQPAEMLALIGHCAADSDNASLLTSLLPALVVVRDQPRLATFVGLLKEEAQADRAGKSFVLARMVELLFIEAIRSCETLATPGLVRGLSDPRIAQAIRLLHEAPARRWTVNALAADCALSRSTLFERFTGLTGMTPMGYLLNWRMTLAMRWLGEPGISMADIAERLGYGSASAFSVAFTRYAGTSPGKYARQRAAQRTPGNALS
ncbi:AraC family transcriptional regulator [Klebsiella quasipneumoniae]|uniref:AraC family transcriptional regulator n=1 Tax=Klebsiella quasipneumoniae TaxID=1463165 RepID=UPI001F4EE2A0|nr:AraC family transcriptional regulator [Klebsiella quasipneumoniae]MCH9291131.1 AraC family transcriptional regulator [Klebsiella quasipneumoniae]